jgi:hypothetical protein
VPIYNAVPGPTNSKTYYPIYTVTTVSPALTAPAIRAVVGTTIPPAPPVELVNDDAGGGDSGSSTIARRLGSIATGIGGSQ